MAHGDASFSAQVRFQQRVTVEIILKTSIVQLIAQFELIVNLTTLNFTENVCALIIYGHDCACID